MPSYSKISPVVFDKKILKKVFPYNIYIGKLALPPSGSCFSMDKYDLKNLGGESPKDHLCRNILKSAP